MKQGRNKKGFTLIEILLIIALIGILVTVIMVSLNNAKIKAQDNAAFTSFKSVAPAAFICLTSGVGNAALQSPAELGGNSICSSAAAVGNAAWPNFSKYGWLVGSGGFSWCAINSSGPTHPISVGPYADGTYGGARGSGDFCIMLQKGNKYIWCTERGCKKEGF